MSTKASNNKCPNLPTKNRKLKTGLRAGGGESTQKPRRGV